MLDAHNLGDNGQAGFLLGLGEELQALGLHALEGVGGGAGLEGAAPEELGPGLLHAFGDAANLLLALHGAGPGNKGQPAAANLLAAGQGDDGVVGVELAVGLFVGLLHALDALHKILGLDILRVDGGGVADKAQHGAVGAHPGVHLHAVLAGEFLDEFIHHFLFLMGFEYDNHGTSLPFTK